MFVRLMLRPERSCMRWNIFFELGVYTSTVVPFGMKLGP